MRWLRRVSGIVWIFSWYTIYLEIFRWHHMTRSLLPAFSRPSSPAVCSSRRLMQLIDFTFKAHPVGRLAEPAVFRGHHQ